jgi:hypothetical protein
MSDTEEQILNELIEFSKNYGRGFPLTHCIERFKSSKSKPKDYEIVKFKQWTNEHGHVCANTDIDSVRRLSDGEVFAVGNKINFETDTYKPIEKFTIENHPIKYNCQAILAWNGNVFMYEISSWIKSKPILFTTEDGKPIYEGDACYIVFDSDWSVSPMRSFSNAPHGKINYKAFSTEAAAKEYVLMNKPKFSIQGIIDLLHLNTPYKPHPYISLEQLIKLLKQQP